MQFQNYYNLVFLIKIFQRVKCFFSTILRWLIFFIINNWLLYYNYQLTYNFIMKPQAKRQVVQITLVKKNQTKPVFNQHSDPNIHGLHQEEFQLKQSICPRYKLEWNATSNQQKQNKLKDKPKQRIKAKSTIKSLKTSINLLKQATDRPQTKLNFQNSQTDSRMKDSAFFKDDFDKRAIIQQKIGTQTLFDFGQRQQEFITTINKNSLPIKPSILTLRGIHKSEKTNALFQRSHYQNTNQNKQNNNSNVKQNHQSKNQKDIKQFNLKVDNENQNKFVVQSLKKELKLANQTIHIRNSEIQTLKIETYNLNQRLQLCITQIDEVEKEGAFSRIIQLETVIQDSTHKLKSSQALFQNKIKDLQKTNSKYAKFIAQGQAKVRQLYSKLETYETQNRQLKLKIICFQDQSNLRSKNQKLQSQISQLYKKITELSDKHIKYTHQNSLGNQLESLKFDHQIMKKKYQTMENLMESKKTEIKQKDQIIKMLLQKAKN